MRMFLGMLAVFLGGAVLAQSKPAEPKVVEEGGKKVLLVVIGETKADVVDGDVTYRILPLRPGQGNWFLAPVEVKNGGTGNVDRASVVIGAKTGTAAMVDDTGREYVQTKVVIPGPEFIKPGKSAQIGIEYQPMPGPKAKTLTLTVKAPGGPADEWRITYPKKTWGAK